jgi:hypothetical protein
MEPTTQNQPSGPEGNQPAETVSDVQQSASTLVAKHRKQRADKGKPRGNNAKPASNEATAPDVLSPNDPVFQLNVELVKKSVSALIGTVDSIVVRRIYNKSKSLGCDDGLCKEYVQAAGLTVDESKIMAECTASIMARSDFLIRHAPEVMLGCVMISYGVRITTTLKRLDDLEQRMLKTKKGEGVKVIESSAQ